MLDSLGGFTSGFLAWLTSQFWLTMYRLSARTNLHRRVVVLFGDLVGAKHAHGIVQDDGREYPWRHVVEPVVAQRRVGLEDGDALDGVADRRALHCMM